VDGLAPFLLLLCAVLVLSVVAIVLAVQARNEARRLHEEIEGFRRLLRARDDRPAWPGAEGAAPSVEPKAPLQEPLASAAAAAPPPPSPEPAPSPALAAEDRVRYPVPVRRRPPAEEPEPASPPVVVGTHDSVPGDSRAAPATFEAFLGGRVLLVAGVITALLGLGWFLKVAIDRGWIAPGARIALGAAAGIAALVLGDRFRAKGFGVFGHGLMGGGLGALYVTTWFASVRYGFLPRTPAFAVMGLLTAGGAALALLRDAPLLAYLGFLGGFLAPAVLSTGEDRLWPLTAWLAVIDAGVLVVAIRRSWPGLDLMVVLASAAYFMGWQDRFFTPDRVGEASAALSLLAVVALATALVPPILRREAPAATALFAALLAGLFAVLGGAAVLHPEHRRALGAGVAGLAVLYLAGARFVSDRCSAPGAARSLLGLALAACAAAVPFVFEGRGVSPAWSATGLALLVIAARGAPDLVGYGGAGMLALAAGESLFGGRWAHEPGFDPVFNPAFLCALAPALGFLAGGRVLGRGREGRGGPEFLLDAGSWLLVAGSWLLAAVLGSEAWQSVEAARVPGGLEKAAAAVAVAGAALAAAAAWRRMEEEFLVLAVLPMGAAFVLGLGWILEGHGGAFRPILNAGFGCCLGVTVAALAAGALTPGAFGRVLQAGALLFLFLLGTTEILAWGRWCHPGEGTRRDAEFRAQVVASVAWAVYAAALLCVGFLRERADLRWAGLVVFLLTGAKVFLYDMAALDVVYRIGSFMVLGILLVGASFLYQRRRTGPGDEGP